MGCNCILRFMATKTTADAVEPVTLTPEMKTVLGLEDCVVGDQYDLSIEVTKVNDDGSIEATVEKDEVAASDEAETPPEPPPGKGKRKMAPAMAEVMGA